MTRFSDLELARVDWSSYRQINGGADGIGPALERLLAANTTEAVNAAYWGLENWVVAQGTVYSSAEPAISVLMAAFLDNPIHQIKIASLDLVEQVLRGWPDPDELDNYNQNLVDRCRERVREGLWLLIREVVQGGPVRRVALDVIELVDEGRAEQVRAWLGNESL